MNGTTNTIAQPPQYSLPPASSLFGWAFSFFAVIGIIGLIAIIVFAGFLLVKFLPQFTPSQFTQFKSPTSLQIPTSSMLASMAFSPFLDLLPFGK
jgi:flagellar biogenesis protein FliO